MRAGRRVARIEGELAAAVGAAEHAHQVQLTAGRERPDERQHLDVARRVGAGVPVERDLAARRVRVRGRVGVAQGEVHDGWSEKSCPTGRSSAGGADPRAQQQLRRGDRPGRQHHLRRLDDLSVGEQHAAAREPSKQHPGDDGVGPTRTSGPGRRWPRRCAPRRRCCSARARPRVGRRRSCPARPRSRAAARRRGTARPSGAAARRTGAAPAPGPSSRATGRARRGRVGALVVREQVGPRPARARPSRRRRRVARTQLAPLIALDPPSPRPRGTTTGAPVAAARGRTSSAGARGCRRRARPRRAAPGAGAHRTGLEQQRPRAARSRPARAQPADPPPPPRSRHGRRNYWSFQVTTTSRGASAQRGR